MIQNDRIQTFVRLINDRLFQGEGTERLDALWKEATHYETCTTLVQKSKQEDRIGKPCGKAVVSGKTTCMCHTPKEKKEKSVVEDKPRCGKAVLKGTCIRFCIDGTEHCAFHQPKTMVTCGFTLVTGKNANMNCTHAVVKGTTLCKRHSEKVVAPDEVAPVEVAPVEKVLNTISSLKIDVPNHKEASSKLVSEMTKEELLAMYKRNGWPHDYIPKSPSFPPPDQ